ncbi:hypothetical protein HHI36_017767 [Cryptolaemus montrouzieri]|uniref:Major facilitator superfamily (MFS) profile domain-containing protein n=1 Tax=Cryptolaemus montrouzieri TaxID=559131 RepID=A0ABD2NPB2_9CUCU
MKEDTKKNGTDTQFPLLKYSDAANFEDAISATKFGKFNLLLLLVAIPGRWSSVFETTTMSYVFPAAQCDLNLSLSNKGLLNAITYLGMVSSAFVWGYLCDSLGRKKLMYIGFFLDACFVVVSSLSQSFTVLLIAKFLGGCIINGPFAALTCYLSEFHSAKYRARVQMVLGFVTSLGAICLPLLAGLILPSDMEFTILNYLKIHPWNVYLLVAALPPFFGGCVFLFLPESPKFLMTTGRNEEALEVLQLVYRINTGKSADSYPIKSLMDERKQNEKEATEHNEKSSKHALADGWNQLKPLFIPPLLQNILLVCGLQMLLMMSINTLRLWLPQLFQAINDYEYYNNGTTAPLCTVLEVFQPQPKNLTATPVECVVNTHNSQVYMNAMKVAFLTMFGFFVAGSLINILGKKRLLFIFSFSAGIIGFSLYFAQNTTMTLVMAAMYIGMGNICINVILSVVVDLFPTTLRTMTISLTMMIGRMGAMTGNLIFPYLLKQGCAPPFISIGLGMISCATVGLLLPNTDMKALQ